MKVCDPRHVLLQLLAVHATTIVNAADTTSTDSGSTVLFIVLPVVVVLAGIVAFFVWKRSQHRDKNRGYGLPSITTENSHGNVAYDQRMDSNYSSHRPDKKSSRPSSSSCSTRSREERPPQWPANGAPTYTRQQQQQQQQQQQGQPLYRPSQYESQYDSHNSYPPPPPPPPEMPMLEPQDYEGRGLSLMELEQSRAKRRSSLEVMKQRQTDPAVVARTQETAEKVMAELELEPSVKDSWIPYDSLYFTREISHGAFGEVWLAQLENTQVAVKKILDEKKHDVKEIECFGAEIKLMAVLKHPKIVRFIGVSWSDRQDLCAVTEFMPKGDLNGYLERRKTKLTWPADKVWLAEDIAEALVYLHSLSPKLIHRDLKSKNVLLDSKYRAKLSDFGISRKRSLESTMTAGVGTIYWTAPEVLMGKKYTEKADIFSFGIVMSEMDTCDVPYADKRDSDGKKLQSMKIIQLVIRQALRPTFLKNCPEQIKTLAGRCLDANPDVRPDASELLEVLRSVHDDLQQ